ncbi:MAG: excinuclease subunit [Candidatus Cloacimonadota bacterium]|jgi:excinuclease UvrABC nuclease subunit|nr:excinuclease subunit [Candidatus Cloacimonadota bacterium]
MKKQDLLANLESIPATIGIIFFKKDDKLLYLRRSGNIRKSLSNFFNASSEVDVIFQLISQTTTIDWDVGKNALQILATEKEQINKQRPEFNEKLNFWRHYFYFAIDFYKVPYFKAAEDTQKDKFYIGPFRSNFFILDLIASFAELLQAPACEGEDFPCHRLKEDKCLGYCVQELHKVQDLIRKYYLRPNFSWLQELEQKQEELLAELQFSQAELLKKQIKIIREYYQHLQFLLSIKKISWKGNLAGASYKIENGILTKAADLEFAVVLPEYRENEILAVNKEQLDEMLWCYNFLKRTVPEKLDKQQQETLDELKNMGYLES